jgi:GH25 family lysozyme M1 (1,4-beta-N-acetylmuramidase)
MVLYLYDIAGSYQAGFDVPKAKSEGFVGGVCKITEGLVNGTDWDKRNKAWAYEWHRQSMDVGAYWGGYHYLRRGNGAAQARYFLDELDKVTGSGSLGCLIQLDNEADADWQTTLDWSNEFYRLTHDHRYLMYTGAWWWNVAGRRWNGYSLTPHLWHSRYVSGNGYASTLYQNTAPDWWVPNYGGWPTATILQFSSKGSCGGLVANVDVNAFRGSLADLDTLTGGGIRMADTDVVETKLNVAKLVHQCISNDDGTIPGPIPAALERIEDKLNVGTIEVNYDLLSDRVVDKLLARLALVQKPV